MFRISLLLSVLVCSATCYRTDFNISGNFICPIQTMFTYHLTVREDSSWFWWPESHGISKTFPEVSRVPHKYSIEAFAGDDWGFEYELFFRLNHNCTTEGNRLEVDIPIGDYPIDNGIHVIYQDLDIANKGEKTWATSVAIG